MTSEATEGPTDGGLVAAVRSGDDRAFEQLYTRYQRRIHGYVLGMVKDYGRAEDVTQEVFISALRRMRQTDREIAFKPWIYEIAKNACIDQFRRSKRTEEVSMDAGEGLGQADQGRLVAGQPTPDAAVDAKQQLDDLCGAFGGLSDSHHEILVLRELEGLSYREIGDRMGLSRPGVESTLFRARKRLGEEYEELVSGERCLRIQSIVAAAASSALGTRDKRRLARHVSHCQPCRRMALAAGLDIASLPRNPARRAAERVAGLVPLPAFLRTRFLAGSEQLVPVSEPAGAAWSKAVAAGAALLVAGVGAGVAPHGGTPPVPKHHQAKPAAAQPRTAAPSSSSNRLRRPVVVRKERPATKGKRTTTKTHRRHGGSSGGSQQRSSATLPAATAPQGGSTAPAAVKPATKPAVEAPSPTQVETPAGSGSGSAPAAPQLPSVPLPPVVPSGTDQVGGQVQQTVDDVGQTVQNTTSAVNDAVENATSGLPTP